MATKLVPVASAELIPGRTYYLVVETKTKPTVSQAQKIMEWLTGKFGATGEGIAISDNKMYLQFKTPNYHSYQLVTAGIIAFIPQIIQAVGLVMTGIGLFVAITAIPRWAIIVAGIGLAILFVGPIIGRTIQKQASKGRETEVAEAERETRERYAPYTQTLGAGYERVRQAAGSATQGARTAWEETR